MLPTEGAIKAKQLDFKEYVLWRLKATPIMFGNYQTHYCSRVSTSEINKIPTHEDLEKAIINLDKCTVVGIVEQYQETLTAAINNLQPFYPQINLKYQRLNTTSTDINSNWQIKNNLIEKLGLELVEELEENNQLDRKLYEAAENILDLNLQKATRKTS